MKNTVKQIFSALINQYFFITLLILIIISFGQIIWMQPWQDDNALFFKLAHIEEPAGFLGKGVFGQGPYRYTATPYYLVYKIFGFNTKLYFGLALFFYFLAAVFIYLLFRHMVNKNTGKIASLLFATNYPTSDSFIRLFNSVSGSLGIIFFSALFISYYFFGKKRKISYYLLALFFYLVAIELSYIRSHFVILLIIIFDVLFLGNFRLNNFKKNIPKLARSLIRLTPFLLTFYFLYIFRADPRALRDINNLMNFTINSSVSLFTASSFLAFPDKITVWAPKIFSILIANPYYQVLAINFLQIIIFMALSLKFIRQKTLKAIIFLFLTIWFLVSRLIYKGVFDNQPFNLLLFEFMGGILLFGGILIGALLRFEFKKTYFFFFLLIILNIAVYLFYDPNIFHSSYNNRYLAFSYIGMVGVISLLGSYALKKRKYFFLIFVAAWGIINLMVNIYNQHQILTSRSLPIEQFYQQLSKSLPAISKGTILYFDINSDSSSRQKFSDITTSSQMPETTAIAWRYGIDRYDFLMFRDYIKFSSQIKNKNVTADKIYTFFYSNQELINTSDFVRKSLFDSYPREEIPFSQRGDGEVEFKEPIQSSVPIELSLSIQAIPFEVSELSLPYLRAGSNPTQIHKDPKLHELALSYLKAKKTLLSKAKFTSSSQWRERKQTFLSDQNPDTIWQADRVLWQKKNESFTIDLGLPLKISKFVWINGFGNNTPTKFRIETSLDNKNWKVVKEENVVRRIDTKDPQVIEFEPEIATDIRMVITQTIGGDSPAIAEAWVVPYDYNDLDVSETEKFVVNPFDFINSAKEYNNLLSFLEYEGVVQVYWLNNKDKDFQTEFDKKVTLTFNSNPQEVKIIIPAGGTKLSKIKLMDATIPSKINIKEVRARYLNVNEIPID